MVQGDKGDINMDIDQIVKKYKYDKYMQSQTWKNIRYAKLTEANWTCERCGYGKYDFEEGPLDVHHKNYDRFGNESLSDLEVLCRPCHEKNHGRQFTERKP